MNSHNPIEVRIEVRRVASPPGFRPADQAAARLDASRFNPSRMASVIDDLASFETDAVAMLRRNGPIARRLNIESLTDDWPCQHCGRIGCDCPEYRGAFDTEGRH